MHSIYRGIPKNVNVRNRDIRGQINNISDSSTNGLINANAYIKTNSSFGSDGGTIRNNTMKQDLSFNPGNVNNYSNNGNFLAPQQHIKPLLQHS